MMIKKMSVKEFREMGGLQEVNRCFLHPRGLALEVTVDNDGNECFGEIWDYRDDPEGLFFGEGMIDESKIEIFEDLYKSKEATRKRFVGSAIQADDETTKEARKASKNTPKEVFEDLSNELRKLLDDLRCLGHKLGIPTTTTAQAQEFITVNTNCDICGAELPVDDIILVGDDEVWLCKECFEQFSN